MNRYLRAGRVWWLCRILPNAGLCCWLLRTGGLPVLGALAGSVGGCGLFGAASCLHAAVGMATGAGGGIARATGPASYSLRGTRRRYRRRPPLVRTNLATLWGCFHFPQTRTQPESQNVAGVSPDTPGGSPHGGVSTDHALTCGNTSSTGEEKRTKDAPNTGQPQIHAATLKTKPRTPIEAPTSLHTSHRPS